MEHSLYLVFGIVIGALLMWLYLNFMRLKAQQRDGNYRSQMQEKLNLLTTEFQESKKTTDNQRQKIIELTENLAEERAKFTELRHRLVEKEQDSDTKVQQLQKQFSYQFELLAEKIFDEKSERFIFQNKNELAQILNPLQDRLKDFETKVQSMYENEAKERFSLEKELKNLVELNYELSNEANKLTNALKGQAKMRGNWGEMVLESLLEQSGLTLNQEFFVQKSFRDTNGKLFQPDVLIRYPKNRYIVIDSKVSLVAYEEFCNSENAQVQKDAAKAHVRSLKMHINSLASKNYQNLPELNSLDFVLMFIPIESAYLTGLQTNKELWQYAYERKVLPVGPVNLIVVLKMISILWQHEMQNKNAREIAEKSGALYDKFVGLVADLIEVGHKMEQAQTQYRGAMNKLHTGKGNLIRRVENLKELGAKTKKSLPKSLVERAEDAENEV